MDKEAFRKRCIQRFMRRRYGQDKRVIKNLALILDALNASDILAFMPMSHEPRLLGYFSKLKLKKNIYVPFMQGESFKMVKLRLPIKKKQYGIKEPPNSFFKAKIDVAIVPVVGVDGDFRRIGFGKGMYDRFFESLRYRPVVIFVQRRLCATKKIVSDPYDIQGDFLVTPKKIYIRGDSHVGRDFSRKFCRHYQWRCRLLALKKDRKR
ncbi:MAG: 5-formyltetrahydrofolate cyclo-ligase [Epsilonproteobacteria bacterium]|nr:5-formyltetrahydrofolate cyclo-ligase [Campylobacterota bacterium]NPA63455.1 5-formyltetrahydrofolate cyclo-ligase [Campylobacterota bacterium]